MAQNTIKAARLHAAGESLQIEEVPRPTVVRAHDVVVRVEACGVIPNMNHVVGGLPTLTLPPLPAVVGLDAAGVITEVGQEVKRFQKGDRVYINPVLSCGTCRYCRQGLDQICVDMTFRGYFGFTPGSERLQREYPWGGYSQYTLAPARSLVLLSPRVTFEQAARFGYLGTSYAGLKNANLRPGGSVLVLGATGTLGVAAVLFALAMGASRVLGVARNRETLRRLEHLAPERVQTHVLGEEPLCDWILHCTDGDGPNVIIDCTTRQTSSATLAEAISTLQRRGVAITVGGLNDKLALTPNHFTRTEWRFGGSCWFSTADAAEMVELAQNGVVNLSVFDTKTYTLDQINAALDAVTGSPGGFTNVVVQPNS